jgi:hypothetical protein
MVGGLHTQHAMVGKSLLVIAASLSLLHAQADPALDCSRRLAEDFVPMTRSIRLVNAVQGVISPSAFVFPAVQAAVTQAYGQPEEWGQGALGFARRYGSGYAGRFIGQSVEHGIAFALHEDNRFFASGEREVGPRLRYAILSTVLARHDDGSRSISISGLGGAAAGSFLTRPWQPPSTGSAGAAAVSFGLTMAVRTGLNVAREFGPAFLGKFLR